MFDAHISFKASETGTTRTVRIIVKIYQKAK